MHGATNISVAAMQIPFAGIKLNECFCCIYCYSFFSYSLLGCSEQEEEKVFLFRFTLLQLKAILTSLLICTERFTQYVLLKMLQDSM